VVGEEITLERILQVYREESRKKALSPLERDFWERVQRYVAGLEEDLRKESAVDPNSAKAALLRDELKKVLKRREQIWQYRGRKIALMACSAASGASVDTSPLTPLEEESFNAMLQVMEEGRQKAFQMEVEEAPQETKPEAERKEEKRVPRTRKKPREDRVLVRILEDIPPFLGLDVTYNLRKEDVISLPEEVAKVLIGKGKAERVKPRL
jgi:DNA replication factor GINS